MKNKNFYTVIINAVDVSLKVKDFSVNSALMALLAGEYLHVGYYKKFNNFYIDFSELNTEDVNLSFEYYNGNAWVELATIIDETEDFKKSGFIYFTRPNDWAEVTVEGEKQFYIRVSPDADLTATTAVNGLSVLLSNDSDLISVRSNIVSKHNNGETWVKKAENSKRHIIQQLRNLGYRKVKRTDQTPLHFEGNEILEYSNLTEFDLLEPFELREASKYFTMADIFLNELSDETDDKYERAGKRYMGRASSAMNVFMLQFDKDDDGEEDPAENEGETRTNLTWV